MEIIKCEINGMEGWKCGENGVCYVGTEAKQRAMKDLMKEKAEEFSKNPAPLPKKEEQNISKKTKKK